MVIFMNDLFLCIEKIYHYKISLNSYTLLDNNYMLGLNYLKYHSRKIDHQRLLKMKPCLILKSWEKWNMIYNQTLMKIGFPWGFSLEFCKKPGCYLNVIWKGSTHNFFFIFIVLLTSLVDLVQNVISWNMDIIVAILKIAQKPKTCFWKTFDKRSIFGRQGLFIWIIPAISLQICFNFFVTWLTIF